MEFSPSAGLRYRVLTICLFPGLLLAAQQAVATTVSKAAVAPTAAADSYILGPGDQILVHVVDLSDWPDQPIRVDPGGFVDFPLIGQMQVTGLTLEAMKQELASRLSRYITAPSISINLVDDQSRPVSIIGAVNNPGVHQLQGPERLLRVISSAGGLRSDAGSSVILTRQMRWGAIPLSQSVTDATDHFSTAKLSLESLMSATDPAENIIIEPDDVISVPKAELIYVVGDVKRAGGFELSAHNSMSVLQALSLSEGLGPSASPKSAKIMRPAKGDSSQIQEIPVNIQKIFAGKAPDVALYANDVLFVPNSLAKSSARRAAEAVLQTATGVAIYH